MVGGSGGGGCEGAGGGVDGLTFGGVGGGDGDVQEAGFELRVVEVKRSGGGVLCRQSVFEGV